MTRKEIIENLEAKNYDAFGDDLYLERYMFPQGCETIEEMVEEQGYHAMSAFLIEDFPDRYEL